MSELICTLCSEEFGRECEGCGEPCCAGCARLWPDGKTCDACARLRGEELPGAETRGKGHEPSV